MDLLPLPFALFILFTLGLIIGSFLDVLASRFHTGKSINGRSRCMSCGHTLSWYELFPLLSYLILLGRCKNCGGKIPMRLLLMELSTGFLFAYVYLTAISPVFLVFGVVLMSLLVLIAVYDINHMIIPHEFVVALCVFALGYVFFSNQFSLNVLTYVPHLISACVASLFYGGLWLISKGRWIGLGDAKLAFPLGFMLFPLEGFSMIVLSFWVGAAISICILVVQRMLQSGKHRLPFFTSPLTMKSEVPFAPFMIVAFILVFFEHIDVLRAMSRLF